MPFDPKPLINLPIYIVKNPGFIKFSTNIILGSIELDSFGSKFGVSRTVIREMTYRFLKAFCLSPGAMERAVEFHRSIAEAVEAGDPDLAKERMHLHMLDIVKNVDLHFKAQSKINLTS